MNKTLVFLLVFSFSLISFSQNSKSLAYNKNSASLAKVLDGVSEAIKQVESNSDIPSATKVSVSLKTEVETEASAGINILIFKIGRKWKRAQSNEITFNYDLVSDNNKTKEKSISDELAKVIDYAIMEASSVENENLNLTDFNVTVSFVLEKVITADGEYEIIPIPITPSLGKSWKKKEVHTINIIFNN